MKDEGLENFQQEIIRCCERYSQVQEGAFVNALLVAQGHMRTADRDVDDILEQRRLLIDCFFDYLVGTSVAIFAHYGGTDEVNEENFVDRTREKFAVLREMKKKQQGK